MPYSGPPILIGETQRSRVLIDGTSVRLKVIICFRCNKKERRYTSLGKFPISKKCWFCSRGKKRNFKYLGKM